MPESPAVVACAADLARLIRSEKEFSTWVFKVEEAGYLELRCDAAHLVLLWPECWLAGDELPVHLIRARSGDFGLLLFGADDDLVQCDVDGPDVPGLIFVPTPSPRARLVVTLRNAAFSLNHSRLAARLERKLEQARYENDMLISIGRALSQKSDLQSLMDLILLRAREVTGADAGSIFVVEGNDGDISQRTLRCVVSQNDSVPIESREFAVPVTAESIAGSCVIERQPIDIEDLYQDCQGYHHDRSFDHKNQYQTRSLLTVPMISARNQVIGVIQLINKRARGVTKLSGPDSFASGVIPFDPVSVMYANSLGSQAGIALENALLYDEVRTVFDGFVRASVTAIESRDPTTSGHSERVARLTVELAKTADRAEAAPYRHLQFSLDDLKEIEYAALLHDFGKVGVRENVLVKARKLYDHQYDLIVQRFQFLRKALESDALAEKLDYVLKNASAAGASAELKTRLSEIEAELADRVGEIDRFRKFINAANQPTVLDSGGFELIRTIAGRCYVDDQGREHRYLTDEEASALQIVRGSLTPEERREIQSHVMHTDKFLRQIPWGRGFRSVPEIAQAHHEKLDGTGYPFGLVAAAIPPPARMMAISDIYDALTASDRPYKEAVPPDRALDILRDEVDHGRLDSDLFALFVDAKLYQINPCRRGRP